MQVILVVTMYSDRYVISLFPNLHRPFPPFSPSLISLMVSVDVKHHVYLLTRLHVHGSVVDRSFRCGRFLYFYCGKCFLLS